jgi:sulfur-carrier protein
MTGTAPRPVTLRYFAWVREKTGIGEETVELPAGLQTVQDLVTWLKSRGPEFEAAFAAPGTVRAAVDRTHVKSGASIAAAREIAFFPPVTGG